MTNWPSTPPQTTLHTPTHQILIKLEKEEKTVQSNLVEELKDEDQTNNLPTIHSNFIPTSATASDATTPNISEVLEDPLQADKISQQQNPEIPEQVTKHQESPFPLPAVPTTGTRDLSLMQIKPDACGTCANSFSRVTNLTAHIKTHNSKGSFQCEICAKALHQDTDPGIHKHTHANVEPCNCTTGVQDVHQKSGQADRHENYCKDAPEKTSISNPHVPSETSTDDRNQVGKEPTPEYKQVTPPIPQSNVTKDLRNIFGKDELKFNKKEMAVAVEESSQADRTPPQQKTGNPEQCEIREEVPFHRDSLKEHTDIHTTIEKELQPASVDENESSPNPFRPGSLDKISPLSAKPVEMNRLHHASPTKMSNGKLAFISPTTLTQHKASEISHSKPHVCETCAKSFSRVSILINHKKTHEDKQSFQCKVCKEAFHQKVILKMHTTIHANACTIFPDKTEEVFMKKEQPTDEVLHNAKETIQNKKQSGEKVKHGEAFKTKTKNKVEGAVKEEPQVDGYQPHFQIE